MQDQHTKAIYKFNVCSIDLLEEHINLSKPNWLDDLASGDLNRQSDACRSAAQDIRKELSLSNDEILPDPLVADLCWRKASSSPSWKTKPHGRPRQHSSQLSLDFIFIDQKGDGNAILGKLIFERIDAQASSGRVYPALEMEGVHTDADWDGAVEAAIHHANANGTHVPESSDLRWRVKIATGATGNDKREYRALKSGDKLLGRSAGVTFLLGLSYHFGSHSLDTRRAFQSILALAALPYKDEPDTSTLCDLGGQEEKKAEALELLQRSEPHIRRNVLLAARREHKLDSLKGCKERLAGKVAEIFRLLEEILREDRNSPRALDFDDYLQLKRKGFVGREWLFEEIDLWRFESEERALLITGDPGSGKTSLVAELIHRNPGGRVIGYHCCQSNEIETLRPGRFVQSLAAMIASRLPTYAELLNGEHLTRVLCDERCEKDPGGAFLEGVLQPLQKIPAPEDGVRYILIDALDEALITEEVKCIVDVIHKDRLARFPDWLRLVATTRNDNRVLNRLGSQHTKQIDLSDNQSIEDVTFFLHRRLNDGLLAEHFTRLELNANIVANLIARSSMGNFLYAAMVLKDVRNKRNSLDSLGELPIGLHEYYRDYFQRAFRHGYSREYRQIRKVLEVLCAALEPLSIHTLSKVRRMNESTLCHQVDEPLSQFIHRRQQPGGPETVEIFHKSFVDWLIDPPSAHAFAICRHSGEKALAAFCRKTLESEYADLDPYVRRNALGHFIKLNQKDIAIKVLSDISFIDTKAKSRELSDLLRDYAAANISSLQPYRLFVASNRVPLEENARHPGFTQNLAFLQGVRDAQPFRQTKNSNVQSIEISKRVILSEAAGILPSLYLEEHQNPVTQLAISSEMLVSCDTLGNTIVWNYGWKRPVELNAHRNYSCASIDPQMSRIAVGRSDGIIELWSFDRIEWISPELRLLTKLGRKGEPVTAMTFTSDGKFLVASDSDGILTFWNVRTREQTVVPTKGSVNVICSVGAQLVLVGGSDGIVQVFHSSGELNNKFPGEVGEIYSIAMMPDGSLVLLGDRGIRRTDPNAIESSIRSLGSQYQSSESNCSCVTVANANCDLIAHTNSSGNIILRSLSTGNPVALLVGQASPASSLALSDDGYVVAGTQNGSLCVWNLKTLVADSLCEDNQRKKCRVTQLDRSGNDRPYDHHRPRSWEAGFAWYSGKKMHVGSHELDLGSHADGFSIERVNFYPLFNCVAVTKSGGKTESFDVAGRRMPPDCLSRELLQHESFYQQAGVSTTSSPKGVVTVSWEPDSAGGGFIKVNHAVLKSCLHSHYYIAERLHFVSLSNSGRNIAIADDVGYFSILDSQSGHILFRLFFRNLSSIAFIWEESMIIVGYGNGKSEIIHLSGI